MLQAVRQRYQVENGRLLQIVDLQDPDTGASDQQVQVLGDAPPGAQEGDSAENPEDLIKTSPDYYPGRDTAAGGSQVPFAGSSGDTYGFGNIGNQLAQSMQRIYGGGFPGDTAGTSGGGGMGTPRDNAYLAAQAAGQFQNPGTAAAQGVTGAPGFGANRPSGVDTGATAPGRPGSAPNTQGVSGNASNADTMRSQILYNTGDPTTAVNNALMDMGVNPFNPGNPFVQFMQKAAPGLAAAFQLQNALGGATAASAADAPFAFKDFLGSSLAGGHTLSGIAGAAKLIPLVVSKLREQQGTTADQVNPFLYEIGNILASGFGEGTAGTLAALLGPSLPRGLQGGYKSGLEKALALSQRNYDYNDPKADIWKFLLGS